MEMPLCIPARIAELMPKMLKRAYEVGLVLTVRHWTAVKCFIGELATIFNVRWVWGVRQKNYSRNVSWIYENMDRMMQKCGSLGNLHPYLLSLEFYCLVDCFSQITDSSIGFWNAYTWIQIKGKTLRHFQSILEASSMYFIFLFLEFVSLHATPFAWGMTKFIWIHLTFSPI